MPNSLIEELPDEKGHFGTYGGMFVPETLMSALEQLTKEYELAKSDPMFQNELDNMLREYVGRPTPLTFAERWTDLLGGAKIYLKREDLLHTGAHKINNAMGQILLAKRLGKIVSLLKLVLVSMEWPRQLFVHDLVLNVLFIWVRSTWKDRP